MKLVVSALSSFNISLCLGLILLFPLWIWYRRYKQSLLERCNITTVPTNWMLGNSLQVSKNHVEFHSNCQKKYGRLYGYYLGTRPQIATTDLELISTIQVKSFDNFHRRSWCQVKGDLWSDFECSLVHESVSLERWREMRSVLSKSFSSVRMKESVELINDALETTLKVLKEKENHQDVDMYKVAEGLTMDIIGRSSCGILVSAQEDPDNSILVRIRPITAALLSLEHLPFGLALLFPEFEFILTCIRKLEYTILRALDRSSISWLYGFIRKVAHKRMSSDGPKRKDLLQSMIDSIDENENGGSIKFTMDETVVNAGVFLTAGYETSANVLGFLSHVLMVMPDVQEKVRQEIEQLVQNEGEIGYNVLQLPYLDAVVNECMRMFPPITNFVNRKAEDDFKYKDVTIPKGTSIMFPIYQLHRDEEYWSQPNTFDPERFMGQRKSDIKSMAFQPFGAGPRVCIGMRLAQLSTKMSIAKLLMKYRFTASARSNTNLELDVQVKMNTMSPRNVFVKLVPL